MNNSVMEDNGIKIGMIPCNVLPPGTVMLISPPTQREVHEAGGDMTKAILKHNRVAAMNHISPSSADQVMSMADGLRGWGLEDMMFPKELVEKCIIDKLPSNLAAALPFGWLLDDGTFIITRDIWSGQADQVMMDGKELYEKSHGVNSPEFALAWMWAAYIEFFYYFPGWADQVAGMIGLNPKAVWEQFIMGFDNWWFHVMSDIWAD